jgi:hypothetical protein
VKIGENGEKEARREGFWGEFGTTKCTKVHEKGFVV